MEPRHIYPTQTFTQIQDTFNAANANDEIIFHPGTYDIQTNSIHVKTNVTIRGGDSTKPTIIGRASSPIDPTATGTNCGIFSITAEGEVRISGLRLEHEPPSAGGLTATIAYFTDNAGASTLAISDCDIETTAWGAICIDSINDVAPGDPPRGHDVIIRNCHIRGGGCSVIFGKPPGYPPDHIIDMRKSRFEISDCHLDPAKTAFMMFNYGSDSATDFRIENNRIGFEPPENTKGTAIGISVGAWVKPDGRPHHPKGRVRVALNKIRSQSYLAPTYPWSAGIWIEVKDRQPGDAAIEVTDNKITLSHADSPEGNDVRRAAIIYEDVTPLANASPNLLPTIAIISGNKVFHAGTVVPHCGIELGKQTSDVIVYDNDLTALTVSTAQIRLHVDACRCLVQENRLGGFRKQEAEAVIWCKGRSNQIIANDFQPVGVPGWLVEQGQFSGGPGYVEMDSESRQNTTAVLKQQWPEFTASSGRVQYRDKVRDSNTLIVAAQVVPPVPKKALVEEEIPV